MTEFQNNIKILIETENVNENLQNLQSIWYAIKNNESLINEFLEAILEILIKEDDNNKKKFISLLYLKEYLKTNEDIKFFLKNKLYDHLIKIGCYGKVEINYEIRGKKCIKPYNNISLMIYELIHEIFDKLYFLNEKNEEIKKTFYKIRIHFPRNFEKKYIRLFDLNTNYDNNLKINDYLFKDIKIDKSKENKKKEKKKEKIKENNKPLPEPKPEPKPQTKKISKENLLKKISEFENILTLFEQTVLNNDETDEFIYDIFENFNFTYKNLITANTYKIEELTLKKSLEDNIEIGENIFQNFIKFKNKEIDFKELKNTFDKKNNNNNLKIIDKSSEEEDLKENKTENFENSKNYENNSNNKIEENSFIEEKSEENFFGNQYGEKLDPKLNNNEDFDYDFDDIKSNTNKNEIENNDSSKNYKENPSKITSSIEEENEKIKRNIKKLRSNKKIDNFNKSLNDSLDRKQIKSNIESIDLNKSISKSNKNEEISSNSINTTDYEFYFENLNNLEKKKYLDSNISKININTIREEEEENLENSDIENIIDINKLENIKKMDNIKNIESLELFEKLKNLEKENLDNKNKLLEYKKEIDSLKIENNYLKKENEQINKNLEEVLEEENKSLSKENLKISLNNKEDLINDYIDLKIKNEDLQNELIKKDEINYDYLIEENDNYKIENNVLKNNIEESNTKYNILNDKFKNTFNELKEIKILFQKIIEEYNTLKNENINNNINENKSIYKNKEESILKVKTNKDLISNKNSILQSENKSLIENSIKKDQKFYIDNPYNFINNFYESSQKDNLYYFKGSSLFQKSLLYKDNNLEIKINVERVWNESSNIKLSINMNFAMNNNLKIYIKLYNQYLSIPDKLINRELKNNEDIKFNFKFDKNIWHSIFNKNFDFPKMNIKIINKEIINSITLFIPITINKLFLFEEIDYYKINDINKNLIVNLNIIHNKIIVNSVNDLNDLFENSILISNNTILSKLKILNDEFYFLYIEYNNDLLNIKIYNPHNYNNKLIIEYSNWLKWILIN